MIKKTLAISLITLFSLSTPQVVYAFLSDSAMRRLVEARPGVATQIGDGLDKILGYVDPATGEKLVTVDQLVEQMKAGGVSTATMAELLKSYFTNTENDDGSRKYTDEQVANAMVFSLISGGVDADEAVRTTKSQVPGTTDASLATTIVEAKVNLRAKQDAKQAEVQQTLAQTSAKFQTAVKGQNTSLNSLTVEEFINLTDNS